MFKQNAKEKISKLWKETAECAQFQNWRTNRLVHSLKIRMNVSCESSNIDKETIKTSTLSKWIGRSNFHSWTLSLLEVGSSQFFALSFSLFSWATWNEKLASAQPNGKLWACYLSTWCCVCAILWIKSFAGISLELYDFIQLCAVATLGPHE